MTLGMERITVPARCDKASHLHYCVLRLGDHLDTAPFHFYSSCTRRYRRETRADSAMWWPYRVATWSTAGNKLIHLCATRLHHRKHLNAIYATQKIANAILLDADGAKYWGQCLRPNKLGFWQTTLLSRRILPTTSWGWHPQVKHHFCTTASLLKLVVPHSTTSYDRTNDTLVNATGFLAIRFKLTPQCFHLLNPLGSPVSCLL